MRTSAFRLNAAEAVAYPLEWLLCSRETYMGLSKASAGGSSMLSLKLIGWIGGIRRSSAIQCGGI